jgi:hypothetical protein
MADPREIPAVYINSVANFFADLATVLTTALAALHLGSAEGRIPLSTARPQTGTPGAGSSRVSVIRPVVGIAAPVPRCAVLIISGVA